MVTKHMNKKEILQLFLNLKIWQQGDVRAPHKPLLILYALSRLQQENKRLFLYKEIEQELSFLLEEFGPSRKTYKPEEPFWRLINDNVWELYNAENVQTSSQNSPVKSDLLKYEVQGGFTEEIYHAISSSSSLFSDIAKHLLVENFPDTIHEDILQTLGLNLETSVITTKRDPHFRERVLRAYEYKCAICGFDVRVGYIPIALEAAHIKWHQANGPDTENNGIALCVLHHKLFDRGAFALTNDFIIQVSDRANGNHGFQEWLMNFHGKKLTLPHNPLYEPEHEFIEWHVREVFKGEYRYMAS